MPAIYVRWILGIYHRFGTNLFKRFPFADFSQPKLDVCTNLQKKHCIGEQTFLVVVELGHDTHHMREMEF